MYLSLGTGKFINTDEIIGIFDLDITSQSHITRNYLKASEQENRVINASEDIPKSYVVVSSRDIYLSQPATATLIKRLEENF